MSIVLFRPDDLFLIFLLSNIFWLVWNIWKPRTRKLDTVGENNLQVAEQYVSTWRHVYYAWPLERFVFFWLVQACTKSIHTGAVYWHEMGHFMWQELRSYNCYSLVNLPQLPLQERKEPLKAERVAINSLYFTLYTLMSGPGYFWCWVGRQQSALKNSPLTQWFLKFSWFQASRALQTLRMLIKEFA